MVETWNYYYLSWSLCLRGATFTIYYQLILIAMIIKKYSNLF